MISKSRFIGIGSVLVVLLIGSPGHAGNLVTNGDFETNGGNGQIGFNTTVTGWTVPATPSYFFVFNPALGTTSGTSADNGGANGQFGNLQLWGPGNGSNNGLTLSPDGGAFVGSDPAFQNAPLSQTLTGLTVGQKLTVTFDYAGAQQFPRDLATTEGWAVSLGGVTQDTGLLSNPNHGFTGWNTSTFGIARFDELPAKAKEYLVFLESRTGVEVGCVSTGPERNQTIVRAGSRFEKLIG